MHRESNPASLETDNGPNRNTCAPGAPSLLTDARGGRARAARSPGAESPPRTGGRRPPPSIFLLPGCQRPASDAEQSSWPRRWCCCDRRPGLSVPLCMFGDDAVVESLGFLGSNSLLCPQKRWLRAGRGSRGAVNAGSLAPWLWAAGCRQGPALLPPAAPAGINGRWHCHLLM